MLLKSFRQQKRMNQSEIAEMLQISVRQYRRIETGENFPRESKRHKLEDFFQKPCRVLFANSVEEIPDFLKCFLP